MSNMNVPGLTKTFLADGAIEKNRIVKFGTADNEISQASAAADLSVGVSDNLGAEAAGDSMDVILGGVCFVEYGGAVTRGAQLTADADGKAVAAATGNRSIGVAMNSGVSGDIGSVLIGACLA